MAQIILTQLRDALRAVMDAGSDAFGEGMEETGDASRQLALLQSLAMMVGKMADGIKQDDALAHWTRQLLQMLEDNAPAAATTGGESMRPFFRAVGEMQALLGVAEDRRAWSKEMEVEDEPAPLCVQDARDWLKQAQALVPVFLTEASKLEIPEADALCIKALAQGFVRHLEIAMDAPTVDTYSDCIDSAKALLHGAGARLTDASDLVYGLLRGIESVMQAATLSDEHKAQPLAEVDGDKLPEGTTSFVPYARHLLAMLLPVAEQHAPSAVDHLRKVDGILQATATAQTCGAWEAMTKAAGEALGLAANEWESVNEPEAYSLWGLYWGIEAALEHGDKWRADNLRQTAGGRARVQAQATAAADAATDGPADAVEALADLPGTAGERADVALGCASEIEQAASWLLAQVGLNPYRYERPFTRLLKEIKRQAGIIMSACDDDAVTLEQLRAKADQWPVAAA